MRPGFKALSLLFMLGIVSTAQVQSAVLDQDSRQILTKLPAVQGATPALAASLDNRPLLITFFASWCPPCLEEFSHLNKLYEKYQDSDLRIVAINVYEAWDDNDDARMKKFIERTRPRFPALVGSESIRALFGGISRIPTVYGFDRDGALAYEFIHKRGASKTNASFEELDNAATLLLSL